MEHPVEHSRQTASKELPEVYAIVSKTIQRELIENGFQACCVPASVLFYEAVKKVNPSKQLQFQLGYIHLPDHTTCGYHLWLNLRGEKVDIGAAVAEALVEKHLDTPLPFEVTETLPEGAVNMGFDMARDRPEVAPLLMTPEQQAGLLAQYSSELGRELFWGAAPPVVQHIREEILSMWP